MKAKFAAACFAALFSGPVLAAPTPVDIRLTEGTNMAVAVSPDGRSVVVDVQGTLWLLADDGEGVALTDGMGDDRQPSFSPDGERIAFQSYRDGVFHIWSVGKDGRGLRRQTDGDFDDREPTWSPDGRSIAFSSDRSGNYDIWVVDVDSGGLRQKTTHTANDYNPAWAPDGRDLVFVSERAPQAGLYRTSKRKGSPEARLLLPVPGRVAAPSFSPDGSRVVWQTFDQTAGTTALWSALVGGREASQLSREGDDVFPFRVAWLDDERFLYAANGRLYEDSFDGGERAERSFRLPIHFDRAGYEKRNRLALPSTTGRAALGIVAPTASPDGEEVAFTALGDLWVRQADGRLLRLTSGPAVEAHPRFSPDGSSLTFISDQAGDMDVWIAELDSGRTRRLTGLPGGEAFPAFSPDGRRIAFFAEQVGRFLSSQLRIVDVTTGDVLPAVSSPMPPVRLDWSADGKMLSGLVLEANSSRFREGSFRLFELDLESRERVLFSPLGEQTLASARRSPDGKWLAWVAGARLWVSPLKDGRPEGIPRSLTQELADWPSWSGDSRRIVYQAGDRLRRVVVETGRSEDLPIELEWLPQDPPGPVVVHAGKLFDGRNREALSNVDISIESGRIRAIEPHSEENHIGVQVLDGTGMTVLPGLFEMHAHQSITTGEAQGRRWLAFGVTSVREPGTTPYDGAERRESWASGRRIGPRNFFSGWLLDGGRVYYSVAEGTRDLAHLELALERARRLQYDLLKTYVRLPDAFQKRALEAAHEMGIPTSSHEIFPAAATGMDAVEHASATSRRGYSPKMSLLGRVYDDVIEIVSKAQLNMTPTLVLPCFWPHLAAHPDLLETPAAQAFLSQQERLAHLGRGQGMRTEAIAARCAESKSVAEIVARGGRITAGTDSPIVPYGFSLHIELQLLVEAGLTPVEALRSATLWSAQAVGVEDDLGSVEVGKLADLVLIDGDPLTDIADTMKVVATLKGGHIYDRERLFAGEAER